MGWTLCSHTVGGPLREPLVVYVVDPIRREFLCSRGQAGPRGSPIALNVLGSVSREPLGQVGGWYFGHDYSNPSR